MSELTRLSQELTDGKGLDLTPVPYTSEEFTQKLAEAEAEREMLRREVEAGETKASQAQERAVAAAADAARAQTTIASL